MFFREVENATESMILQGSKTKLIYRTVEFVNSIGLFDIGVLNGTQRNYQMPSLPFYRHMGERSITPIEY
jgi:hypothetical protein